MESLTKRQADVLAVITTSIAEKGYAPSLDEIAEALNLRSISTIHKHLTTLARKGRIIRDWNRSRAISIVPAGPTPEDQRKAAFTAGYLAFEAYQTFEEAWLSFIRSTDGVDED